MRGLSRRLRQRNIRRSSIAPAAIVRISQRLCEVSGNCGVEGFGGLVVEKIVEMIVVAELMVVVLEYMVAVTVTVTCEPLSARAGAR